MRITMRAPLALFAVLFLVQLPARAAARTEEIHLSLAPGPLRLALPSPDGARLAVLGGSGEEGREHTVFVVDCPCGADSARVVTLSRSAPFPKRPDEAPIDYLRVQWSPDGTLLYALGSVYRLQEEGGALTARALRTVPKPVLDFRFGPADRAAGIGVREARRREVRKGQEAFCVIMEYAIYPFDGDIVIPITTREKFGALWLPEENPDAPVLEWEPDGKLLIFYPYHYITERFEAGKERSEVKDRRPAPRAEPGMGPFAFSKPCARTWKLVSDGRSDRVMLDRRD
jgi:hypothetical protein